MSSRKPKDWVKSKNRRKVVRSIFEAAVLITLLIILIRAIFIWGTYQPYDEKKVEMATDEEDTGFIALSYFGVDRNETKTLVSTKRLKEHIDALQKSGYVTVSQQDIIDYYKDGKKLPKKSLFLMFEDGRRDTAIFAQKITEQYNYLSTIMTYASKFEENDSKFLSPKDLLDLEKGSYCELGTNGYRLEYINVFDRYDRFLGGMNTLEYAHVQPYLGRKYNHYLMDFLRDEYDIPKETYEQMKTRIDYDYDQMQKIYTEELGRMPGMYALMHANTGMFGENDKVSAVNQDRIFDLFDLNFNREGFSLNTHGSSVFDLTRMQPQAYWHTNHLLMRIHDDTDQNVSWVDGNLSKKNKWEEMDGKSEFYENEIYLTCESEKTGTLKLRNSDTFKNLVFTAELKGNKLGAQTVYLRADDTLQKGICVKVKNNELLIFDQGKEIYRQNIDTLTEGDKVSIEEDDLAAQIAEKELEVQYAATVQKGKDAAVELAVLTDTEVKTVEEGAEEYIPDINIHDPLDVKLQIALNENTLSVAIDDFYAVKDVEIASQQAGNIYLQSGWGGDGYSQRNLTDDIYDGVFVDVCVTENTGAEKERVLYDNRLHGWEQFSFYIKKYWNKLVNWFINTF